MPHPIIGFRTGSLHKDVFKKLQELARAHGLTQRGVVMLGVLAIVKLGGTAPTTVDELVATVRDTYHGGA